MKKNYLGNLWGRLCIALLFFITAFIIHSCKKDTQPPNQLAADNTSQEMKTWLSEQKADSITVSNLTKQAEWQTAHTVQTDSLTYLIVKFPISQQKFDDPNKKVDRYLVIVKNNGVFTESYLYDVFGDATQISQNADQYITNYNKNFSTPFTGNLTKLTLQANLKETEVYSNGELRKRMVVVSRKVKSKLAIQTTKKVADDQSDCIAWYLVTYFQGVEISEEYLFTLCGCGGSTQSNALRNHLGVMSVFIKPTCSTGGGSSGGGGDPGIFGINNSNAQIANINFNAFLAFLRNNGYTTSDPQNITITVDGINFTGRITIMSNAAGEIVAGYFSPDQDTATFPLGYNYNLGDGTGTTGTTNTGSGIFVFGPIYGSSVIYTDPSVGGGGNGTITEPTDDDLNITPDPNYNVNISTPDNAHLYGEPATTVDPNADYYTSSEIDQLIANLQNGAIQEDPIEFYLILNYKGSKLLNTSIKSIAANNIQIGDYLLTPHYDSSNHLLFYAAWRNATNGIELIIRADALNIFKQNYKNFKSAADWFYLNGVPSKGMIQVLGGDYWKGIKTMNIDAIHSPQWWAYAIMTLMHASIDFATPSSKTYLLGTTISTDMTSELEIPSNYTIKLSIKEDGVKFVNPSNVHDYVRIMPGNPYSPYSWQGVPYVVRMLNGKTLDINGYVVPYNTEAAHIPITQYKFTR